MTTRESLHELVERLSEADARALLELAEKRFALLSANATEDAGLDVIDGRRFPVLAALWDNPEDAVFDRM